MEPLLTSAEMNALDRYAARVVGIPPIVLMENAGRAVAEAACRRLGDPIGKNVVIVCGTGNNGGDGFVAARHLAGKGAHVSVVLLGEPSRLKGEAKKNFTLLKNFMANGLPGAPGILRWRSSKGASSRSNPDVVIDAIFGTGFRGNVGGEYASAIKWMNSCRCAKVSVDIPSGLNADDGTVGNVAVRATVTVTMGFRKTGLMLNDGRTYSGEIEVADISLPGFIKGKRVAGRALLDQESVREWLPVRAPQAHKHSVGKILLLAGSRGFTGAAALASVSAMKSGGGSAVVGVPSSVHPILARKLREVIVLALPETGDGALGGEAFAALSKYLSWADVVVAGPGLSLGEGPRELVRRILRECALPLVLDADALNVIAEQPGMLLRRRSRECILTPHEGEFSRLTGIPASEIARKRIDPALEFAKKYRLTLVLKGAPTIIASETGDVWINPTGNPGMATAGSGDVLTGMIGGLWAQGMKREHAAGAAVYLHGLAGDLARSAFGERSLMAGDILDNISPAFLRVGGGLPG